MTCREVEHVATPEGSAACVEHGGTRRADAVEPLAERAGGMGRPGDRVAGGRRGAELSGGGTPGGAARQRHGRGVGGALQSRGPAGSPATAWRAAVDPLRCGGPAAHPGRSPAAAGSRTRRHGDVVVEHAATRLAPGCGWAAGGEHVHDLADAACRRSELAEESDLVRDRRGRAQTPARRRGGGPRSRCGGEKTLIERAYTLGAALGLAVWCEDEAGPFQAVPHPGYSWRPQGQPAAQPHEYVRGGTAKILTLFQPATGRVRLQPVTCSTNAIVHPWLKTMLAGIVAALLLAAPLDGDENRRLWPAWQQGLTVRFTLPHELPPRRLLLIWDNLTGHKTPEMVLWLCRHGIMPLYTPLGGSWLNLAEAIQRLLKRRALDGQHPQSPAEIGAWFEQTAQAWNQQPTPFVWDGKRRQRRRKRPGDGHPVGGAAALTHRFLPHNRRGHVEYRMSCQVT